MEISNVYLGLHLVVMSLVLSSPISAQTFAKHEDLTASYFDTVHCDSSVKLLVESKDSSTEIKKNDLNMLFGAIRAGLQFECPQASSVELLIDNNSSGQRLARGNVGTGQLAFDNSELVSEENTPTTTDNPTSSNDMVSKSFSEDKTIFSATTADSMPALNDSEFITQFGYIKGEEYFRGSDYVIYQGYQKISSGKQILTDWVMVHFVPATQSVVKLNKIGRGRYAYSEDFLNEMTSIFKPHYHQQFKKSIESTLATYPEIYRRNRSSTAISEEKLKNAMLQYIRKYNSFGVRHYVAGYQIKEKMFYGEATPILTTTFSLDSLEPDIFRLTTDEIYELGGDDLLYSALDHCLRAEDKRLGSSSAANYGENCVGHNYDKVANNELVSKGFIKAKSILDTDAYRVYSAYYPMSRQYEKVFVVIHKGNMDVELFPLNHATGGFPAKSLGDELTKIPEIAEFVRLEETVEIVHYHDEITLPNNQFGYQEPIFYSTFHMKHHEIIRAFIQIGKKTYSANTLPPNTIKGAYSVMQSQMIQDKKREDMNDKEIMAAVKNTKHYTGRALTIDEKARTKARLIREKIKRLSTQKAQDAARNYGWVYVDPKEMEQQYGANIASAVAGDGGLPSLGGKAYFLEFSNVYSERCDAFLPSNAVSVPITTITSWESSGIEHSTSSTHYVRIPANHANTYKNLFNDAVDAVESESRDLGIISAARSGELAFNLSIRNRQGRAQFFNSIPGNVGKFFNEHACDSLLMKQLAGNFYRMAENEPSIQASRQSIDGVAFKGDFQNQHYYQTFTEGTMTVKRYHGAPAAGWLPKKPKDLLFEMRNLYGETGRHHQGGEVATAVEVIIDNPAHSSLRKMIVADIRRNKLPVKPSEIFEQNQLLASLPSEVRTSFIVQCVYRGWESYFFWLDKTPDGMDHLTLAKNNNKHPLLKIQPPRDNCPQFYPDN